MRPIQAIGKAFRTFNFMPWHRSISKSVNQHFVTKFTDSAIASMRLNYRMEVNLTTHTQVYAFYSGLYDNAFIERLQRLMIPDCCVVDAGANIGFYTVPLTMQATQLGGQVHAFEPLKDNYERILSNLKLNNISERAIVNHCGLSSQCTTTKLVLREDFTKGSNTGNASIIIEDGTDEQFNQVEIELTTLDHYFKTQNLNRLDLIKADVEGHEDFLLEGGKETIQKFRPVIFMEVNKTYFTRRNIDLMQRLNELLPDAYSILRSKEGRGLKWNPISTLDQCNRLDNVFLTPDEKMKDILELLNA